METKNTAALLPCPFCGREPILKFIGNDHTKSRAVEVKCSNMSCRVARTDKAIFHDHAWLENVAREAWNTRASHPAPQAAAEGVGSIGDDPEFVGLALAWEGSMEKETQTATWNALVAYIDSRAAPERSGKLADERDTALEDAARIAENFGPARPIVSSSPSVIVRGRWEGEQAASANIANAIRALKSRPAAHSSAAPSGMHNLTRWTFDGGMTASVAEDGQWVRFADVERAASPAPTEAKSQVPHESAQGAPAAPVILSDHGNEGTPPAETPYPPRDLPR